MASRVHQLDVFADYRQFYVCDAARQTDTGEIWSDEALDRMVGLGPDLIAVGTARNMDVPVTLEIGEQEPDADFDAWEQVVECGLALPSGRVVVAGCNDYFPDCPHFTVAAGPYNARISFSHLADLSEDGLAGNDRYRVQLWPGAVTGISIRKR